MRKAPPLIVISLAAACSPAAPSDPGAGSGERAVVAPSQVKINSMSEVEGFWHVARFGNYEPGWQDYSGWRSAYVQIDGERLTYRVGCNQSGNPARIKDGVLQNTGDDIRVQTAQGCGTVRENRDNRFFSFFSSNPQITKIGPGKLRIANDKTELILLDEVQRLAKNGARLSEIKGRWVPQSAENFDGWGVSGTHVADEPGILTITANRLEWSRCPRAAIVGAYTADHRFVRSERPTNDCEAISQGHLPGGDLLMRVMQDNPAFIRSGPDRIVMFADGRAVHLQTEQSVLNPPPPPPLPAGLAPPPPPPPPPAARGDSTTAS